MLYEQQKTAGIKLAEIESKVITLRKNFTSTVLQKHYWETEATVDKLFTDNSSAEVSSILKKIEGKNLESKLTTQFNDMMTLGGPGSKLNEPILSRPGRLTTNEAGRNHKKAILTERLHRGTQASVKQGRRQMTQRLGDHFVQKLGESGVPLEYEEYTPMHGPSKLGKRSFHSSHLPTTPDPMTPHYSGLSMKHQMSIRLDEPSTPLYGL